MLSCKLLLAPMKLFALLSMKGTKLATTVMTGFFGVQAY